jgi:carbonic anhydrase
MNLFDQVQPKHRALLERLRAGNERFVQNVRSVESLISQSKRGALVDGQSPFAIILSCADSRAPSELLFDCGLGDLFVVRVAGNVVAPSIVGSVEFAASKFGTELVVVMGHTHCGAISATLDALAGGPAAASENLHDIVSRISPALVGLAASQTEGGESLLRRATRANICAATDHLRHDSRILERMVSDGSLLVVGAEYDLETGRVEFFDGLGIPAD